MYLGAPGQPLGLSANNQLTKESATNQETHLDVAEDPFDAFNQQSLVLDLLVFVTNQ